MAVELHEQPHGQFIEDDDLPQRLYERARRASLDRRVRINKALSKALIIKRATCRSRGSSTTKLESDEEPGFMFEAVFGETRLPTRRMHEDRVAETSA